MIFSPSCQINFFLLQFLYWCDSSLEAHYFYITTQYIMTPHFHLLGIFFSWADILFSFWVIKIACWAKGRVAGRIGIEPGPALLYSRPTPELRGTPVFSDHFLMPFFFIFVFLAFFCFFLTLSLSSCGEKHLFSYSNGQINFMNTKLKCRHLKKLPRKGTLR
jgi:hypothetical protein